MKKIILSAILFLAIGIGVYATSLGNKTVCDSSSCPVTKCLK